MTGRIGIAPRLVLPARLLACVGCLYILGALGGCLHAQTRHDYDLSVRGTLIDGPGGKVIDGLHVVVKVGDEVIYDGYTDAAGELEFTYSTSLYKSPGELKNEPVTVIFEVQAGDFGTVEVPVTFGGETNFITLGRILMRPGSGAER